MTDALSVGELMTTIELDGNEARGTFDRFYEWIQARRSASFQLVVGAFLAAVGALVVAIIQNQLTTDLESQTAFLLATVILGLVGLLRYRSLARAPADYLEQLAALKVLQKLRG